MQLSNVFKIKAINTMAYVLNQALATTMEEKTPKEI